MIYLKGKEALYSNLFGEEEIMLRARSPPHFFL
jgi:hypothetical protein